jgi:threonine aldolase
MVERLQEDHDNARLLAAELAAVPGLRLDPSRVQTNMVMLQLEEGRMSAAEFLAALREAGVLMIGSGANIRAVTHYGITAADVREAAAAVRKVIGQG